MKKTILLIVGSLVAGAGACTLLLPDGMAVKGPIFNSLFGRGIDAPAPEVVERRISVPEGFGVALWAEDIPNGRFMRISPAGSLLISQPRTGRILHILADADGDGMSDGQRVFLEDLDRPHGIDFRDGHLYIGEASAIARVAFVESGIDSIEPRGEVVRIAEGIPEGGNHWARTLRFGPDGGLYMNVGSSCNVCEEEDPRRAAMLRFEADGSGEEIYAAGLRNSTGFDWRPGTNEFFATDNGRDLLGDDYPPCELNQIVRGGFYGWPYANGNNESDPDFGAGNEDRVASSITPAHPFRAHNAPLGMTFLRHPDTPANFNGAALVALHGSWNRSILDGYKVVSLHWDEDDRITERDFLTGFQIGDDVIGRPVDVAEGPDGAIYVSDDYSGAIYRVIAGDAMGAQSARAATTRQLDPSASGVDPLAGLDGAERKALTDRGNELFAQHACATCHIEGQTAPGVVVKRLDGLATKFTVTSLADFFRVPRPPMPVFDLPEEERRALAVFLFSDEQLRDDVEGAREAP
jgi:glucose/arabinose dehydrogenase/mono/diheme cytochrome c family protein